MQKSQLDLHDSHTARHCRNEATLQSRSDIQEIVQQHLLRDPQLSWVADLNAQIHQPTLAPTHRLYKWTEYCRQLDPQELSITEQKEIAAFVFSETFDRCVVILDTQFDPTIRAQQLRRVLMELRLLLRQHWLQDHLIDYGRAGCNTARLVNAIISAVGQATDSLDDCLIRFLQTIGSPEHEGLHQPLLPLLQNTNLWTSSHPLQNLLLYAQIQRIQGNHSFPSLPLLEWDRAHSKLLEQLTLGDPDLDVTNVPFSFPWDLFKGATVPLQRVEKLLSETLILLRQVVQNKKNSRRSRQRAHHAAISYLRLQIPLVQTLDALDTALWKNLVEWQGLGQQIHGRDGSRYFLQQELRALTDALMTREPQTMRQLIVANGGWVHFEGLSEQVRLVRSLGSFPSADLVLAHLEDGPSRKAIQGDSELVAIVVASLKEALLTNPGQKEASNLVSMLLEVGGTTLDQNTASILARVFIHDATLVSPTLSKLTPKLRRTTAQAYIQAVADSPSTIGMNCVVALLGSDDQLVCPVLSPEAERVYAKMIVRSAPSHKQTTSVPHNPSRQSSAKPPAIPQPPAVRCLKGFLRKKKTTLPRLRNLLKTDLTVLNKSQRQQLTTATISLLQKERPPLSDILWQLAQSPLQDKLKSSPGWTDLCGKELHRLLMKKHTSKAQQLYDALLVSIRPNKLINQRLALCGQKEDWETFRTLYKQTTSSALQWLPSLLASEDDITQAKKAYLALSRLATLFPGPRAKARILSDMLSLIAFPKNFTAIRSPDLMEIRMASLSHLLESLSTLGPTHTFSEPAIAGRRRLIAFAEEPINRSTTPEPFPQRDRFRMAALKTCHLSEHYEDLLSGYVYLLRLAHEDKLKPDSAAERIETIHLGLLSAFTSGRISADYLAYVYAQTESLTPPMWDLLARAEPSAKHNSWVQAHRLRARVFASAMVKQPNYHQFLAASLLELFKKENFSLLTSEDHKLLIVQFKALLENLGTDSKRWKDASKVAIHVLKQSPSDMTLWECITDSLLDSLKRSSYSRGIIYSSRIIYEAAPQISEAARLRACSRIQAASRAYDGVNASDVWAATIGRHFRMCERITGRNSAMVYLNKCAEWAVSHASIGPMNVLNHYAEHFRLDKNEQWHFVQALYHALDSKTSSSHTGMTLGTVIHSAPNAHEVQNLVSAHHWAFLQQAQNLFRRKTTLPQRLQPIVISTLLSMLDNAILQSLMQLQDLSKSRELEATHYCTIKHQLTQYARLEPQLAGAASTKPLKLQLALFQAAYGMLLLKVGNRDDFHQRFITSLQFYKKSYDKGELLQGRARRFVQLLTLAIPRLDAKSLLQPQLQIAVGWIITSARKQGLYRHGIKWLFKDTHALAMGLLDKGPEIATLLIPKVWNAACAIDAEESNLSNHHKNRLMHAITSKINEQDPARYTKLLSALPTSFIN